ncbi:protein of unknown function [Pseudomonas mediterranea]
MTNCILIPRTRGHHKGNRLWRWPRGAHYGGADRSVELGKLNNSLKDIDRAIDAHQYNRATTLTYTCLEGLYKAYVRKHVSTQEGLTELIPLCKTVKEDISRKLQILRPFPVEIVNAMPDVN